MAETAIEKLQPCLLDRLTDDEPGKKEESRSQRVISHQKYKRGVLRDLHARTIEMKLVADNPPSGHSAGLAAHA